MNARELKNPLSGFHSAEAMRRSFHVMPLSVEVAWNVVMSWFAGSGRRSSHIAWNVPCSSTATHGKNWLLRAGAPVASTLTGIDADHVNPWSYERLTLMSPLARPWMEFV